MNNRRTPAITTMTRGGFIVAVDDGARRQVQPNGLAQQSFRRALRKPGEKATGRSLADERLEPARSVRGRTPAGSTTGTTIGGTAAF
jgi:hypothetical protein